LRFRRFASLNDCKPDVAHWRDLSE
jgi:hypothetical protein